MFVFCLIGRTPGGAEGTVGRAVVQRWCIPGAPVAFWRCGVCSPLWRVGKATELQCLGGTEQQCLEGAVGQGGGRAWVGAEHCVGGRSSAFLGT